MTPASTPAVTDQTRYVRPPVTSAVIMASYRIYRDSNVEDAFNAVINCDIQKLEENYSDFDYATTIDPSITDDTFEMTAIHWAAFSGHVKMVQWLLNKVCRKKLINTFLNKETKDEKKLLLMRNVNNICLFLLS